MTGWNHYSSPYNSVTWLDGAVRPKVTLARVFRAEEGQLYQTVPFVMPDDGNGERWTASRKYLFSRKKRMPLFKPRAAA